MIGVIMIIIIKFMLISDVETTFIQVWVDNI